MGVLGLAAYFKVRLGGGRGWGALERGNRSFGFNSRRHSLTRNSYIQLLMGRNICGELRSCPSVVYSTDPDAIFKLCVRISWASSEIIKVKLI